MTVKNDTPAFPVMIATINDDTTANESLDLIEIFTGLNFDLDSGQAITIKIK